MAEKKGNKETSGRRLTLRAKPCDSVAARLSALEERVRTLEGQLGALAPKAAPSRPVAPPSVGPRCPGCHLEVASIDRGSCPWCGFVFNAWEELKRGERLRRKGGRS